MKSISLLIVLSLMLSACSFLNPNDGFSRSPANTKLTVDDILSFKKTSTPSNKEVSTQVKNTYGFKFRKNMSLEFVPDSKLPKDTAFKIAIDVENQKYKIKIFHSEDAFYHLQSVEGLTGFLNEFDSNSVTTNTPYALFEMYYNAKEGDVEAMETLLKIRDHNELSSYQRFSEAPTAELKKALEDETAVMHNELAPELKKVAKDRKVKKEARKSVLDALDKASSDQQFKALIAKNDRKGAVELLKKYLPYEDMAPFERKYWDSYLEIIKHPLPHDERIIAYRGIDDDFIHQAIIDGVEVDKETAIKDAKAFVMSTVLVKNQGSWNRRLRSLEAMEEKFIGTVAGKDEFAQSARITTMFKNHSADPKGSPFLSFTPNIDIATNFGRQKNSVFLIDPRVLQFNFTSGYEGEKEFLAALMTFPDDLVAIWTSNDNSGVQVSKFFDQKLEEFVSDKFGKANKDKILAQIKANTKNFYDPVYSVFPTAKESPGFSIMNFFKIFTKGKEEPAPPVNASGSLSCVDMIKAFWVK